MGLLESRAPTTRQDSSLVFLLPDFGIKLETYLFCCDNYDSKTTMVRKVGFNLPKSSRHVSVSDIMRCLILVIFFIFLYL